MDVKVTYSCYSTIFTIILSTMNGMFPLVTMECGVRRTTYIHNAKYHLTLHPRITCNQILFIVLHLWTWCYNKIKDKGSYIYKLWAILHHGTGTGIAMVQKQSRERIAPMKRAVFPLLSTSSRKCSNLLLILTCICLLPSLYPILANDLLFLLPLDNCSTQQQAKK